MLCFNSGRVAPAVTRACGSRASARAGAACCTGGVARFELLDFAVQMADFVDGALDLARKTPSTCCRGRGKRESTGNFHLGAVELGAQPLAGLLVGDGVASTFSSNCCSFFCRIPTSAKQFGALPRTFKSAGRAFLDIAQVGDDFPAPRRPFSTARTARRPLLNQRRPADGLLHPQLAPLHAAGQIHFALSVSRERRPFRADTRVPGRRCRWILPPAPGAENPLHERLPDRKTWLPLRN
jgi:hypothetical protein